MERGEVHHQLPGGAPLRRVIHNQQRPLLRKHRVQIRLLQMLREQHAADRVGRHLLDAGTNLAALLEVGIFNDHLLDHLKRLLRGADHQSLRADAAGEVVAPGGVPVVQTSEREDEALLALSEADRTYGRDALHAASAAVLHNVQRIVLDDRELEGERHDARGDGGLGVLGVENASVVLSRRDGGVLGLVLRRGSVRVRVLHQGGPVVMLFFVQFSEKS